MFHKVLVANRGEIAVRAFRAATELGAKTVAVYPFEDRNSEYRLKADEAYLIGEQGHPVRAYLDPAGIVEAAVKAGADAVYPGYGFLSENPDLASQCAEAGITFVGPPARVLELTGNKARAIEAAVAAGLPTLRSTPASADAAALLEQAQEIGFPLFVKAVSGGGGRGMRRVDTAGTLPESLEAAMREAESAFGDGRVYLEEAMTGPRHIEVQILADGAGNVIHLFERDCSVQRRHQKVVELAPAPDLDPALRDRICAHAVDFAREIGYVNAGTVEFLLDPRSGRYVFIEMNPRIQVEHTVTEEVTDVDLVSSQLRIASGETLADLGLDQEDVRLRGTALQCRITTEDPANGFRPDTGKVTVYRAPGGAGIRLDGGTVFDGAVIGAYFDSMLVKLTCRGRDLPMAVARAKRALAEFRIRGVNTNIAFLENLLSDPDFLSGNVTTSFIDERPELLDTRAPADRGSKILSYVAHVTVNQPHGERRPGVHPGDKLPALDLDTPPPDGALQRLRELGPERFAAELRSQVPVAVTDTTFRDAHQSLLATRVRTRDLLRAAPAVARLTPQLLSVEAWGGATYDVALRFLKEDPWDRLAKLREAMPNLPIQMLLRGRNTVAYTPYPTKVTDVFVQQAAQTGIDIFRIFDALNSVEQMKPAIDAVRETGTAIAEVALCYTGSMLSPDEKLYTLDYYLDLAERIVDAGAHVLAIKDMAGLLRAPAAAALVTALRERFELPVHLHTHDTAGGQIGTLLAAIDAGVDAVDVAAATMAGTTSQPSMSALVAALEGTERDPGLDFAQVTALEPFWEATRTLYRPFESGLPGPTGRVYEHEIPGGQLSNLRQQAIALGLGDRFEKIEDMYAAANDILGNIVKVTPSSKVVGDLALALVGSNVDPARFAEDPQKYDIPDSVIGFLNGELGDPPGGWPEPFRTKALQGRSVPPRVTELEADDEAALESDPKRTLNRLLFPGPTAEFEKARELYSDLSALGTVEFLHGLQVGVEHAVEIEPGKTLLLVVLSIGEPDDHGMRTVITTLNGQTRQVQVRDESVQSTVKSAERADPGNAGHVAAPFGGVVTVKVTAGDPVSEGDPVATIEAMKMEATISAPVSGTVERLAIGEQGQVEGGDLLVVIS